MIESSFFPRVAAVLTLTAAGCESAVTDLVESPLASATAIHATQGFATVVFSTPSVEEGLAQGVRRVSNGSRTTHALVVILKPSFCQSLVFIPHSDFSWSMQSATLKASSACGDVDLSWSQTGPVTTNPVNLWTSSPTEGLTNCGLPAGETVTHRVTNGPNAVASVTGTYNGEVVTPLEAPTIARQTDVLTTCTGS